MKTQSRIDVPRNGTQGTPGKNQIGGIAWAGIRGISRVEVRLIEHQTAIAALGNNWVERLDPDFGEWREAQLGPALSGSSWRRWALEWEAEPGNYYVDARATDGEGIVQTHLRQDPFPNGATGYPQIFLWIEDS